MQRILGKIRLPQWRGFAAELSEVFAMDLRSLALVRIITAGIVLVDLARRAPDIPMFYGDGGVVPSSIFHSFWTGEWAWSLHLLDGGSNELVAFLFFVQALVTLALFLGFWTRTSSILAWVLLVSLHNANPLILLGGDYLLRAVMFVGMFLPWGATMSLDKFRSQKAPERTTVLSPWTAAFLIQLALMYYFASLFKNSVEWNVSGSALYYIASIDQYATPLSAFFLQFPEMLRFFTFAVDIFQHFALFLLFLPFYNRYVRVVMVVLLAAMHVTFALVSHLGIFSWISIAALAGFIPSLGWDALARYLASASSRFGAFIRELVSLKPIQGSQTHTNGFWRASRFLVATLGILYIFHHFIWQAADFAPLARTLPWDALAVPSKVLRIDQRWNLFAPRPYTDDGWDIVEGHLANGQTVDLFRGGAELTYEKPERVFALYGKSRLRQYTLEMRRFGNEQYREYYADYLCRSWNETHYADRLESLEFVFMLEETVEPGLTQGPAVRRSLLEWTCV